MKTVGKTVISKCFMFVYYQDYQDFFLSQPIRRWRPGGVWWSSAPRWRPGPGSSAARWGPGPRWSAARWGPVPWWSAARWRPGPRWSAARRGPGRSRPEQAGPEEGRQLSDPGAGWARALEVWLRLQEPQLAPCLSWLHCSKAR